MKVIGSGFGRTGTLSLKHALEEIGMGPCYHMEEVLKTPAHVPTWNDHANGKPVDWHRLFAGYHSAVDFPASIAYRELVEVFPEAKVIHTVRDPDRWYESTLETIYQGSTLAPGWLKRVAPRTREWADMADNLIWDGLFEGRFEDREFAINKFNSWTEEVIATVPTDRLLVFRAADGWGPLCDFLGVLQPDIPYPHVNDREQMLKRFRRVKVITRATPVVGAGLLAGSVGLIRRLRRR